MTSPRGKLIVISFVTSALLLTIGVLLLFSKPNAGWLAYIILVTGVIVALACTYYLLAILPAREAEVKEAFKSGRASLSDLLEWRVNDPEASSVAENRITARDWPMFLRNSALAIKSELVDVLAERVFSFRGRALRIAYVRCEDLSLDRHIRVFEGWVLDAPDVKADSFFQASRKKQNIPLLAFAALVVLTATMITAMLVSRVWSQLNVMDVAVILSVGLSLIGFAFLAYVRTIAKSPTPGKERDIPQSFRPIYSKLSSSRQIRFFCVAGGPNGLLVAVEPTTETFLEEDHGVVPIEGPHGNALDDLLAPLKDLRAL